MAAARLWMDQHADARYVWCKPKGTRALLAGRALVALHGAREAAAQHRERII